MRWAVFRGVGIPGWAAWSLRFVVLAGFVTASAPAAIVWGALMVRQYIKDRRAAPAPPAPTAPPPQVAPVVPDQLPPSALGARREREKNDETLRLIYGRSETGRRLEAAGHPDAVAPFCGSCGKPRDGLSLKFCRWCGAA